MASTPIVALKVYLKVVVAVTVLVEMAVTVDQLWEASFWAGADVELTTVVPLAAVKVPAFIVAAEAAAARVVRVIDLDASI